MHLRFGDGLTVPTAFTIAPAPGRRRCGPSAVLSPATLPALDLAATAAAKSGPKLMLTPLGDNLRDEVQPEPMGDTVQAPVKTWSPTPAICKASSPFHARSIADCTTCLSDFCRWACAPENELIMGPPASPGWAFAVSNQPCARRRIVLQRYTPRRACRCRQMSWPSCTWPA